MKYSSINIQGNIVSSDVLTKIAQEDIRFQKQADFGLDRNTSVREEIGIAWAAVKSHWNAFKLRKDRLKEHETGTSETRRSWMVPFLQELGYDLEVAKLETINGKTYAISHRAINRDGFPVHIVGVNQSLDKRAEHGTRLSPHALTQEYLNNHDHLYALTSNGRFLRLLRDATRLSRLSYLEFDLERMMEEDLYAEFALLFRLLHVSRMPEQADSGEESIIDFYHKEALTSGTRIRNKLSEAVEESLKELANGLLAHRGNAALQEAVRNGDEKPEDYYLHLLRTIYRILFLLVIEERNLIYPEKRDEQLNRKRKIYYDHYSLQRLARLAERKIYVDPRKTDLWQSLLVTFRLFEKAHYGQKLGIEPLGAGLFGPDALGPISQASLSNETVISLLRKLVLFENENGQTTRVNYADLDVEEFGSVYEGLLEYDPEIYAEPTKLSFGFKPGTGRSKEGAHYTPEELVKPLIKHSLDYIIEDKLKAGKAQSGDAYAQMQAQCDALLTITVCDVACGSGHILLSAARRIGMELAILRESIDAKSVVEQPSPPYLRQAVRDVIRHCIYGVDINPLAVELCKVAFWLEAHNPGEPLHFLDHRIKNGNAIVGLAHVDELYKGIANEAFKALPGDDKEVTRELLNQNKRELGNARQTAMAQEMAEKNVQQVVGRMNQWAGMPERTPEEIEAKAKAYKTIVHSGDWWRLKVLADVQVSQFFIPKVKASDCITSGKYLQYLINQTAVQGEAVGIALGKAAEQRIFHWFLEFPEVFAKGGFDCILGNPPFLGGQKLTGTYGNSFTEFIKYEYSPIGSVDLVTYFFRRIFDIIKVGGFQSLISTNTIAQGSAREGGLEFILQNDGDINHAIRSMKWPGLAAVEVALVSIYKGAWKKNYILDLRQVLQINSYLDDQEIIGDPFVLNDNLEKIFQGSIVLGDGYVLQTNKAIKLIEKNPSNKKVLFPYMNGRDLNSSPTQSPSRWVINFFDWPEEMAKNYPDCYEIIQEFVKPERQRWKKDKNGNDIQGSYALRKPLPEKWWIYAEKRPKLYKAISSMKEVLAIPCQATKYPLYSRVNSKTVFSNALAIVANDSIILLSILNSTIHSEWAWKYASSMKSDMRYIPTNVFENFPFSKLSDTILEEAGKNYYHFRKDLLLNLELGLTKTYNQFHNNELTNNVIDLPQKEFQKKFGKETWNLYNHLEVQKEGGISYQEAVPLIFKLRELHKEMDKAVLASYGWHEDSKKWGKAIKLRHDFYEVDYLPENDRVRYTIHPEARKEVLKRLLLLNHERFEEEVAQGLHKRKDVEAYYQQKGKPIPEVTVFSDGKAGKTAKTKAAKKAKAAQPLPPRRDRGAQSVMFGDAPATTQAAIAAGSKVTIKNHEGSTFHYILLRNAVKGQFTGAYKQISTTSALAEAMLGKKPGEGFEFGGVGYEVQSIEI